MSTMTGIPASRSMRGVHRSRTHTERRGFHLGAAWLVTAAFVVPVYIALVGAFKTQDQTLNDPLGLPIPFTMANLAQALSRPDHLVQGGLLNSLLVTACTLIIIIPFASATSFWISQRGRVVQASALAMFALGLMVPPQTTLLPVVQMLQAVGLDHTYIGLILNNVGGGFLSFAIFVYVGFLRTIPQEVVEAARVDGAGEFRTWWRVVFPLLRPATATVGIFLGLWTWNDFVTPQFILGAAQGQTITTGLYITMGGFTTDFAQLYGIMFLAAVIPLVGYLVSQREFIHGLVSGATK